MLVAVEVMAVADGYKIKMAMASWMVMVGGSNDSLDGV